VFVVVSAFVCDYDVVALCLRLYVCLLFLVLCLSCVYVLSVFLCIVCLL